MKRINVKASNVSVGDLVEGIGIITERVVQHRDVAVKGSTKGQGVVNIPKKLSTLLKARLAQEAVEQCYRQEPVSVRLSSGTSTRTFGLDERVTVQVVEPVVVAVAEAA